MRAAATAVRLYLSSWSNQALGLALVAIVDVGLGAVILAGSDARVAGPSFQTAKMLAPLEVWAALLLLFGALIFTALLLQTRLTPVHGRLAIGVPCALAAGWHTWWSSAFAVTAIQNGDAALTGIFPYAGYAALHLIAAVREEE